MARKKLIAGNWKMNKTPDEAAVLAKELVEKAKGVSDRDIMIAPVFTALAKVNDVVKGTNVKLGAQNMYCEDSGAFTGEVSADMLIASGVTYVILGHSERRSIFKEDDALINKKVKKALAKGLIPVFCVGETLAEREGGKAESIVGDQVKKGLEGIAEADAKKVVIAYEPVWAIGTGKTATPNDADAMHKHIRSVLSSIYSGSFADAMVILYGGSMNDKNADELLNMPNIDGGLVGGAALKSDSFARIFNYTKK